MLATPGADQSIQMPNVQRHHLEQRLGGLGDDERLAFGGASEQPRQVGFGFADGDDQHG
jgi:hypothetical protein